MAIKKKKKGKKKKSSSAAEKKPDDDKPKIESNKPDYVHPIRDAPMAELNLKMAAPLGSFQQIDKWRVPCSTRLYMIQKKIVDLFGGSVSDVRLFTGGS